MSTFSTKSLSHTKHVSITSFKTVDLWRREHLTLGCLTFPLRVLVTLVPQTLKPALPHKDLYFLPPLTQPTISKMLDDLMLSLAVD